MKNFKVKLSNGENENLVCMSNEVDWSSAVNDWSWLFVEIEGKWEWIDWDEANEFLELGLY